MGSDTGQFMRRWGALAAGLALGSALAWVFPLVMGILYLPACGAFWLGTQALMSRARARIQREPLYQDRYWTDSELDALKQYAFYWLRPAGSARLAQGCWFFGGLGAPLALRWFWLGGAGGWAFPAVCVGSLAFLARQARILDPVSYLSLRAQKKDYSLADEWGAVMDVREKWGPGPGRGFSVRP